MWSVPLCLGMTRSISSSASIFSLGSWPRAGALRRDGIPDSGSLAWHSCRPGALIMRNPQPMQDVTGGEPRRRTRRSSHPGAAPEHNSPARTRRTAMFEPMTPARCARLTAGAMAMAALSLMATSAYARQAAPSSGWKPVQEHLLSRFARDVSPARALPDYPRPQLVRSEWLNLNGLWEYAIRPKDAGGARVAVRRRDPGAVRRRVGPVRRGQDGRPGPAASGIAARSAFPRSWAGKRVWLHFDAVDWDATVSVNGKRSARTRGGYDPFAFDITDALKNGRRAGARGVGLGSRPTRARSRGASRC